MGGGSYLPRGVTPDAHRSETWWQLRLQADAYERERAEHYAWARLAAGVATTEQLPLPWR